MKKDEKEIIFKKYHDQGLSDNGCLDRVKKLEKYSKGFVKLKKENDKLKLKIEKLNAKIEYIKSNKSKPNPKKQGIEMFNQDIGEAELKKNKRYITRILGNMEIGKEYFKTDFKKEFLVPQRCISFCLNHLISEGKIEQIPNGTRTKYVVKW